MNRPSKRRYSFLAVSLLAISTGLIGVFAQDSSNIQIQTEVLEPIELSQNWQYRWGDSPKDESGIPLWSYETGGVFDWKK
jgi:hypothetical protein